MGNIINENEVKGQVVKTNNKKSRTVNLTQSELWKLVKESKDVNDIIRDLRKEGRRKNKALNTLVGAGSIAMGIFGGPIGAFASGYLSTVSLSSALDNGEISESDHYDIFSLYFDAYSFMIDHNENNNKKITEMQIEQEFTEFKDSIDAGTGRRYEDLGWYILDAPKLRKVKYDGEWMTFFEAIKNDLIEMFD